VRLRQLKVDRMPGFTRKGFTLSKLGEGINCIWGPNGSGKTTACLAIRRLLWPHDPSVQNFLPQLSSIWVYAGQEGEIVVAGREYSVSEGLPLAEIQKFSASLYTIAIDDLFASTDSEFASLIAKEVRGGYDLQILHEERALSKNFGDKELKQFRDQQELFNREVLRQQEIYRKESQLEELEEQIQSTSIAEKRLLLINTSLNYKDRLNEYEKLQEKMASFPEGVDKIRNEDRKLLENLQDRKRVLQDELNVLPTSHALVEADLELAHRWIQEIRVIDKEIEACERSCIEASEQKIGYCHNLQLSSEKLDQLHFSNLERLLPNLKELHEEDLRCADVETQLSLDLEKKFWTPFSVAILLGSCVCGIVSSRYVELLMALIATLVPLTFLGLMWQRKVHHRKELQRKLANIQCESQKKREEIDSYLEGDFVFPEYTLVGSFLQQLKLAQDYGIIEKKNKALLLSLLQKREKQEKEVERLLGRPFHDVVEMEHELALQHKQRYAVECREKCLRELGHIEEQLLELLSRCRCQNAAQFLEQYTLLSSYGQIVQTRNKLEGSLSELKRQLEMAPEWLEESRDALEAEKATLILQAASLRGLIEKKAGIEKEIERVQLGRDLEERRAASKRAEQLLDDKKNEFRERALGLFLLEEIEESFRKETRPEALRNADRLFQRFTKGAFAIQGIEEKKREAFFVIEDCVQSTIKQLHELSRGTRLQLLLAIRLGFIQSLEKQGLQLPIILDEADSHADDERWQAIGEVLMQEASLGRQILYFTCHRFKADMWKAISDQVTFHNLTESFDQPPLCKREFSIVELPLEDETLDAYMQRTRVPGLDFSLSPSAQHISHFLTTSQELQMFLQAGISTLGQVQKMDEIQCLTPFLSPSAKEITLAKGDLLEKFYHQYQIGRPPLVERSDLEEALEYGCISEKFFSSLTDLMQQEKGCGHSILTALQAKKVKGYRAEKIEELRDFLLMRTKLDSRPPQGAEELRLAFWEAYLNHADVLPKEEAAKFIASLLNSVF